VQTLLALPLGFLLDQLLGDPPAWPHPVRWIGRLIQYLETLLRPFLPERLGGIVLLLVVTTAAGGLTWLVLELAGWVHEGARLALASVLVYFGLAARSLECETLQVLEPCRRDDWTMARQRLSLIVGRDTDNLAPEAIYRACIETVAENTSDAVVAPLFYAALAGPVGMWVFKAISTLDSMVGYRNERYLRFGWASARMDDLANFVPARLTWLLLALAALLTGDRAGQALRLGWRDGRKHPSPNAAWAEAAMAGALGVQLGGPSTYGGNPSLKPFLGEATQPLTPAKVRQAIRLMRVASALALGLVCTMAVLVSCIGLTWGRFPTCQNTGRLETCPTILHLALSSGGKTMTTSTIVPPQVNPAPGESPFVSGGQPPEPFTLVIFGATGDLATRKLWPALYGLCQRRLLPDDFAVVGVARRDKKDEAFRAEVRATFSASREDSPAAAGCQDGFLANVFYHRADFTTIEGIRELAARLRDLEGKRALPGNRLFYLATDPDYFGPIVAWLADAGLVRRDLELPWARVVIEKPFGHDRTSARELDRDILRFLRPDQIYRIDHYLGKETVQNLLAFRFGNALFEPLFNRQYVDHVQITVGETVGMEGRRGAFYDHAGALRDVVQNHLLQLLALVAMDPPATLKACDLSDAKLKVLRTLVPLRGADVARLVVRGQYGAGTEQGRPARAYREEEGVARDSATETYVALRAEVESWRWAGVPFLLRTGKHLPRRVTEIAVQFRLPPLRLFHTVECEGDFCDLTEAKPAVLAFRIQPDEGISLSFSAKRPGMQLNLYPVRFEFDYEKSFRQALPEAYERLLLDALRGDATLFMRSDELDAAWAFATPILEAWRDGPPPEFPNYAPGTWGPAEANRLVEGCRGGWRQP